MEDHLVGLTGDWAVSRDFAVLSAGFAVTGLDVFGARDESVSLRAVASDEAFREAVTWQSREALASAVDKLVRNGRGSPARRLRREEIVASYWQRYCAKSDTIGIIRTACLGQLRRARPGCGRPRRRSHT